MPLRTIRAIRVKNKRTGKTIKVYAKSRPVLKRIKYRKTVKRTRRINSMAGAITQSAWSKYGRKISKKVLAMKRVGAPDIWSANFAQLLQTTPGLQQYYAFGSATGEQLREIASNAGNQSAPNQVLFLSSQAELTFSNPMNCPVEMDIYDLVPKRDVLDTTTVTLTAGTYVMGSSPVSYIEQGTKASATLSPTSSQDPHRWFGSIPQDSPFFKDYFAISKTTTVMLASGAAHRHLQKVTHNYLGKQGVVASSAIDLVKGCSYSCLVRIRGLPATTLTGGDPDTPTLPPLDINVVTSFRMKYTFVQDVNNTLFPSNILVPEADIAVRNIGSGVFESVGP